MWGILIYFFNLKKYAAGAYRLLAETYSEAALSERSRREWFQNFKNGAFDIEDKEHRKAGSVRRRGNGSIIGKRFVPNARRTKRWTILRIKHKLPLFHKKCPIFNKKQWKFMFTPDRNIS